MLNKKVNNIWIINFKIQKSQTMSISGTDIKFNHLLSFWVILLLHISCNHSVVKQKALIHFNTTMYNLGEIDYGQNAECEFRFKNTGSIPLIIQNVKFSCGCIKSEWPRRPISSGNDGIIKVKYDSTQPGIFNKTIKIFFNGDTSPVVLNVKGQINYPKK